MKRLYTFESFSEMNNYEPGIRNIYDDIEKSLFPNSSTTLKML